VDLVGYDPGPGMPILYSVLGRLDPPNPNAGDFFSTAVLASLL
jgi:hypothetical protein